MKLHTVNSYKYFGSKIERRLKLSRVYIRYIKTLVKQICFFFTKYIIGHRPLLFFHTVACESSFL